MLRVLPRSTVLSAMHNALNISTVQISNVVGPSHQVKFAGVTATDFRCAGKKLLISGLVLAGSVH